MKIEIYKQGIWETRRIADNGLFWEALFTNLPDSFLEVHFSGCRLNVPILHHSWSGTVAVHVNDKLFNISPFSSVWVAKLPKQMKNKRILGAVCPNPH